MTYTNILAFAKQLDKEDTLKHFRARFHIPKVNGKQAIYFTGNSLGLQPRSTKAFVTEELEDWAALGVEGHMHSRRPWLYYHKFTKKALAKLAGAKLSEVVDMNQLTVNLHLLLVSFYSPTRQRFKILAEHGAFSSDQYVLESQLRYHGFDPAKALIEIKPREGEHNLRTADIIQAIDENRNELALVLFCGVQYYTGQFFNIKAITKAAHGVGAIAGFDLAHAIGNVPLNLHKDDVDFAAWCSYKYLNSGPGAIAGAFVHERHGKNFPGPRFAGWWGYEEKERFQMRRGFVPMEGVDGWQLSNFPILPGAAHLAALEIFEEAGIKNLRAKSLALTGYLEYILKEIDPTGQAFQLLTPANPKERGCQLSIFMKKNGKKVFQKLSKEGIIADWREPNVIRIAPTPLYNTFEEVFKFGDIFKKSL